MEKMMEMTKKFFKDEEGVTALEYAAIAALILAVMVILFRVLGSKGNSALGFINGQWT